ncbi:DUF1205 domain-containing protein [Thermobifida alba]|uniref:DUF1205 domain-containing protein n=1 Tax=Thermobifida alba TaxID=53522 RepID=A0ABY4KZJ4_THEAE|nr:nucleotide disphospho-sugar-binding domain-containing protein [Thermobifida alba]UPT20836.1 DUF1205 domain-containing protein [Thermobifida alba]
MRVLFTVSPWQTHYASMIPLGWALQAAGHEVRVLCARSQTPHVGAAGLLPVPVLDGMDVATWLRLQYYEQARAGLWPYPWLPPHPETGHPLTALDDFDAAEFQERTAPRLAERAARSFDSAVEFTRAWRPDIVLHDPASPEGQLAARVARIPAVLCLWGPVGTREPAHMSIVLPDHSASFPRYGLGEHHPDSATLAIDPCPASLEPPTSARRLRVRYVPYNGTAPVPKWTPVPARRPRVCVTWSTALTVISGPDSYLLPTILRGLRDVDCEVVVTATEHDAALLGKLPPDVRVVPRLPIQALLPHCDAVVHHGGSGSTLTSLWAGVPQLVTTFAAEQAATGTRTAATGAAIHLPGHHADSAAIGASVTALLSDRSYRSAAERLRGELAERPAPSALVTELEELAAA